MCLLVLHISDMHIKNDKDQILNYSKEIAACTYSRLPIAELVVIVVSGDIAYSGQQAEYESSKNFFMDLRDEIQKEKNIPVKFVIVAGNHDCDFGKNTSVRRTIIGSLESGANTPIDEDFINVCTEIQNNFFEFRDFLEGANESDDKLWRVQHFEVQGKKIRFDALNISWVSKLKEEPGKLFFPVARYEDKAASDADIRFVVMHHPMNWFHQSMYRDFRSKIRKIADIIISGHERVTRTKRRAHLGAPNKVFFTL